MSLRKRELRAQCLSKRLRIRSDNLEKRSAELVDRLLMQLVSPSLSSIFLFAPFRSEPNLFSLLAALPKVMFSLPVVSKIGEDMEFHRYELGEDLIPNRWGILEPKVGEDSVASMPDETTTLLIPSVALDRSGYRLGYGAGYYDRYMASCPNSASIGICFSEFIFDEIPNDYWDLRLNYICSEREFLPI